MQRIRAVRRLRRLAKLCFARYLKIGLRWLKGVLHKGRDLLSPLALSYQDTPPCFASKKAKKQYYDAIWFSRIYEIKCSTV